jgi:hypothetical protein
MAKKKAETAGEPAKKRGPKPGAKKKPKKDDVHTHDHLHLKSLTIHDHDNPGHSIHACANADMAGVWLCGPKPGECLALVSVGDTSPYVAVYGGKEGYACSVPAVALSVTRDGKTVVQTCKDGEVKFADLDAVLAHAEQHGLMGQDTPEGIFPVAFATPPHVDTKPTPEQEAAVNAREGAKTPPEGGGQNPADPAPDAPKADDAGGESQEPTP